MTSQADLTNPIFQDEDKARAHLEAIRWPDGPFCPHCGSVEKIGRVEGRSHRPGLHYCGACTKQFTVTVGTVFERSHVPLHKWLLASHLMASSKKGVSAHQLHRMLGVTYKTAWFMAHRLREAMTDGNPSPMGGEGKTVEADETYIGVKKSMRTNKRGGHHKNKVVSLVERGGKARSFHVDRVTTAAVREILVTQVHRTSELMTDEATWYMQPGAEFARHGRVNHRSDEYVSKDDPRVHTNTIEGFFSVFKRGMKGVYQHCGEQHLQRYLTEFDFRYNHRVGLGISDVERCIAMLKGIEGKRLTYRRTGIGPNV